jgi:hypothetical protein
MDNYQLLYADSKLWIFGLLIGFILCFFGNTIFLKSIFVFGFIALALPGYLIGSQAYGLAGGILGFLCSGIIGGILFIALYQVGIFMLGLLVGGAIGLILTGGMIFPVILGIISGILFVLYTDAFIIFGTALLGSYIICESLVLAFPESWLMYPGMSFIFKILVLVAGMLCQVGTQGKY